MTRMLALIPGLVLDLTSVDDQDGQPWDFNNQHKREKAERIIAAGDVMMIDGM